MQLYVQKPCEAVQFNKTNLSKIVSFLPEERFVFYGIETLNGKEQKVFDDDLSTFSKIGGFLYYNKETKIIQENDWVIKRKNIYEVLSNDYFLENFILIPFVNIPDISNEDNSKDIKHEQIINTINTISSSSL